MQKRLGALVLVLAMAALAFGGDYTDERALYTAPGDQTAPGIYDIQKGPEMPAPVADVRNSGMEPELDATWDTPYQLTTASTLEYPGYATARSIYVDAAGNVHVIYYTSSSYEIVYRKYDAGTSTWLPETVLTNGTDSYYRPAIAGDNSGNLHVSWYSSTSPNYNIWYKKYDATTSTWGCGHRYFSTGLTGEYQYYPHVVCRPGGDNVHIVWYGYPSGLPSYYNVNHLEYVPGSGWSSLTVVDTSTTETAYDPSCAVDASNNVYVVWVSDPRLRATTGCGIVPASAVPGVRSSRYPRMTSTSATTRSRVLTHPATSTSSGTRTPCPVPTTRSTTGCALRAAPGARSSRSAPTTRTTSTRRR